MKPLAEVQLEIINHKKDKCLARTCKHPQSEVSEGLGQHYKETVAEFTETCPNQGILNYRKLTDFCRFGQITVDSDIFCQLSVILDDFLSIFCSLGCLDSDMFLSIRSLFPCSAMFVVGGDREI